MNKLKAVIFDHTTLLVDDPTRLAELRALLKTLETWGIVVIAFSTHSKHFDVAFHARNLPLPSLILTRDDVGKNKGSPSWVERVCHITGIDAHHMLYVGDDDLDYKTAINAGVMYLHVLWSGKPDLKDYLALSIQDPRELFLFITHYLLPEPRWEYSVNLTTSGLTLRCLLGAGVELPFAKGTFNLKNVFTYNQFIKVGRYSARDVLMQHVITSLYLEGLLRGNPFFVVYPSSKKGKFNPAVSAFVKPSSRLFHGYYREDLLVRHTEAKDTSMWRVQNRSTMSGEEPTINEQSDTVYINPNYSDKLLDKTVIVFDDFTTQGMSLEWAKNLLYTAGAKEVILTTVGKYKKTHTVYTLRPGHVIEPFSVRNYPPNMFSQISVGLNHNTVAASMIAQSFAHLAKNQPLVKSA